MGTAAGMTMSNPTPGDPGGASSMAESGLPGDGSASLLDGGSAGTDDGPAGIPAALVGRDKDGDEVPMAPAAGDPGTDGPGGTSDPMSPADSASPEGVSAGRSESASGGIAPGTGGGPPSGR